MLSWNWSETALFMESEGVQAVVVPAAAWTGAALHCCRQHVAHSDCAVNAWCLGSSPVSVHTPPPAPAPLLYIYPFRCRGACGTAFLHISPQLCCPRSPLAPLLIAWAVWQTGGGNSDGGLPPGQHSSEGRMTNRMTGIPGGRMTNRMTGTHSWGADDRLDNNPEGDDAGSAAQAGRQAVRLAPHCS
eukprot:gene22449-biopygen23729